MSTKKEDTGKLYHKLHQLQKRIMRWKKNGHIEKIEEIKPKKRKLQDRIKASLKNSI